MNNPPPNSHGCAWNRPTIFHSLHPDEPPPSYADATSSPTAPLLVGPPPDYGTHRAYPEPGDSSIASTDETSDCSLLEWINQALIIVMFVGVLYCLWLLVNDPPDGLGRLPG